MHIYTHIYPYIAIYIHNPYISIHISMYIHVYMRGSIFQYASNIGNRAQVAAVVPRASANRNWRCLLDSFPLSTKGPTAAAASFATAPLTAHYF